MNRLHTDVLEDAYGPIHPEVIKHDSHIREAYLADEIGIARTYALSFFPEIPPSAEIDAIDKEIRAGGSIGKTFKKHGYEIRKNVISVFVLDLPGWLQQKFAVDSSLAKARLSEFYAKKQGTQPVIYATVLEVYTPDFREPVVNAADLSQINPPTESLLKNGIKPEDVWDRITNGNRWDDLSEKYRKAEQDGIDKQMELEEMVKGYISSK